MSTDFEEQLISQLILDGSSIDQTGAAVFKTIFAAGRQTEFLKALSAYASKKDGEIEKVCHQQFQNFVSSIDELMGLREAARRLREKVSAVLEELGRCGQLLYDTKVEMYETQKMLVSTQRTVNAMNDCLQTLNVAQQATLEIMDQNFGQALRLIEQLQGQLLPRIDQYSFSAKLHQWIPSQLATVRSFAVEELKMWLSRVRDQSGILGEVAFNRAQKRIERWRELYEGVQTPTAIRLISAAEDVHSAAAYVDLVEMEREDAASIIDNQQVQVDFAQLLKAVHLFDLMNQRVEFQSLFSEYRRAQAKVIFDLPVNLKDGKADSFSSFLHNVCGFFIIEYFIVRKPQKFYSPSHVEGLWETAVSMINNYVLESIGSGSDQTVLMKIKWLQVFFLHAIEVYDLYSIGSMMDTILSLFYRYVDLSKNETAQKIQTLAMNCELRPMAASAASISRMQQQFHFLLDEPVMGDAETFPFSEYVVSVYNCVCDFIASFYVFLEGVPQQSSELDDIAKKNCDWLLEEAGNAYIERISSVSPEGIVQMIKDLNTLAKICGDIARLLTLKRTKSRSNAVTMNATNSLQKAAHEVENQLLDSVNREMDKFLSPDSINFTPATPPSGPSRMITSFVQFYNEKVNSLKNMLPPQSIKQLVFNMFSHLSTSLTEWMYDKRITTMNMNFIQSLAIDLKFIKEFAEGQVNDPLVLETFNEVQQLVTLMTVGQPHEYLDPVLRNRKYPNLRPNDLVIALQKVKEPLTVQRSFQDFILLLR